jgi:flagellar biosynthesis protein FliR
MNVFVVGFPIKIIGGLVVLLMTIPGLRVAFEELTTRIGSDLAGFVRLL